MSTSAAPRTQTSAGDRRRITVPTPRRLPRAIVFGVPALLLVLVALVVSRILAPQPPSPAPAPPPAQRFVAHGSIVPTSQARVGTLSGGVLLEITAGIGTAVEPQRELARVRGPSGIEVLTAPFGGTVTGLLANTGDTLVPGAGVVMVADLTRLQVQTNDVDEFLIGRVQPGQPVTLQVEALDRRELSGRVQTVGLQPQATPAGDQHYPVTIDIGGAAPDFRPGMSVRIVFPE
jgi:hypothetical protein